jgi:hypothetical protein
MGRKHISNSIKSRGKTKGEKLFETLIIIHVRIAKGMNFMGIIVVAESINRKLRCMTSQIAIQVRAN